MGLRKLIFGKECDKPCKRVIRRAIEHCVAEGERIRSQDLAVYNFISTVYGNNREIIRKKYNAYKRLRDYKLNQIGTG